MGEKRPLLVRMDPDLHQAVASAAEREDRSMAAVVREALRDYTRRSTAAETRKSRADVSTQEPEFVIVDGYDEIEALPFTGDIEVL